MVYQPPISAMHSPPPLSTPITNGDAKVLHDGTAPAQPLPNLHRHDHTKTAVRNATNHLKLNVVDYTHTTTMEMSQNQPHLIRSATSPSTPITQKWILPINQ